jgi:hypothetical protein
VATETTQRSIRRSKAWIYYMVLALISLSTVFAGKPVGLLGVAAFGLYSSYLFRGGWFVLWIW